MSNHPYYEGTRQYIGARYVPKFADPIEWSDQMVYEPMTIVTYMNSSYTSRKQVPAGTLPTNNEFWALTGNYNAAIGDIQTEVDRLSTEIDGFEASIDAVDTKVDALDTKVDSGLQAANTAISINTNSIASTNTALNALEALVNSLPINNKSYIVTVGPNGRGAFPTVQQAVDYCATHDPGGVICIYPGTYNENVTCHNANGFTMLGLGQVIISSSANYPDSPLYIEGNASVRNIEFHATGSSYALHVEAQVAESQNDNIDLRFDNCFFLKYGTGDTAAVGIGAGPSTNVVFNYCRFDTNEIGLYIHNDPRDIATISAVLQAFNCQFNTVKQCVWGEHVSSPANTTLLLNFSSCFAANTYVLYHPNGRSGEAQAAIPTTGPFYLGPYSECINIPGLSTSKAIQKIAFVGHPDPTEGFFLPLENSSKYIVTPTYGRADNTVINTSNLTLSNIFQNGQIWKYNGTPTTLIVLFDVTPAPNIQTISIND